MRRRTWPAAFALAVALAWIVSSAAASPSKPADLQVVGGADTWHANNRFELKWTNPPAGGAPLAATHYRIRNPQGIAIQETEIGWVSDGIASLAVPKIPGTYSAEIWLEDASGQQGPAATTQLRFDDVKPAAVEPVRVLGWISHTAFPLRVRLGHPPGPAPISGIRGYAVAINTAPGGNPCVAPDRCSDAETTLRTGANGDELSISTLPEGTSYLHAVAVSGSGMKSPVSGHTVLRIDLTDPVTQLAGATASWTNRTVWLTATAMDSGSGMATDGVGLPPFTAIRIDNDAPTVEQGKSVTTSVIDEGAHLVAYYARDAAGNVNDGAAVNGIPNRPPKTAWVRIDRTPPAIAFANSQDPRDPDLMRVRIGDALSGADLSRGWIGVRRAGSGDRFDPIPPAPQGNGVLCARWDSDVYPAGKYEFRAIGYDVAGNSTATTRRGNGGQMVLSNPLKAVTALRTSFRGQMTRRIVPYGRGVLYGGRLKSGFSSPLGGMPVRIVERFADGAHPSAQTSIVRTAADGTFWIRSTPGPSRTITAAFDGSPTFARSAGHPLQLQVRSHVRLQASSGVAKIGGEPLIFRGKVGTPPGTTPAEGKSVQLQFRLPGLPWAEFRTIQADRDGRFRYAYRFSDDDSRGARFQFRAYVPAQDDWPYEPGGSRPVIVLGR
jgi:hypothetical protein